MKNTFILWILLALELCSVLACKKQASLLTKFQFISSVKETKSNSVVLETSLITEGDTTVTERGVCWGTSMNNLTIEGSRTSDGSGSGTFTSRISPLIQNTTYFFRPYAKNGNIVRYGENLTQKTPLPSVFSVKMTGRDESGADFEVTVPSDESNPVLSRGICWSTTFPATISDNKVTDTSGQENFKIRVEGLDSSTQYYFRAFATYKDSTVYEIYLNGSDFVLYPTVYTNAVVVTNPITAVVRGGFDTDWRHPVTTRGFCWSTMPHPTIADHVTTDWTPTIGYNGFKCTLTGLIPNTTYYLRAYAGSGSTHYGAEIAFSPEQFSGPTVSDIDGNLYHTVTIGTQTWMVENLKTSKYRNGDPIPNVTDQSWLDLTSGAWCNYTDANMDKFHNYSGFYGKLYNWYAVNDPRKLAPEGWHIPSDSEWETLINYQKSVTTSVEKSLCSKSDWFYNYTSLLIMENVNSSGFTALPAGCRVYHGGSNGVPIMNDGYYEIGTTAYWWSSTLQTNNTTVGYFRIYLPSSYSVQHINFKMDGYSVRCIKD